MRLKTVTSLSLKPFSMHPNSAMSLYYFVLNNNFEVAKCFPMKHCTQDPEVPSRPRSALHASLTCKGDVLKLLGGDPKTIP
jgi:hypothetical protein